MTLNQKLQALRVRAARELRVEQSTTADPRVAHEARVCREEADRDAVAVAEEIDENLTAIAGLEKVLLWSYSKRERSRARELASVKMEEAIGHLARATGVAEG